MRLVEQVSLACSVSFSISLLTESHFGERHFDLRWRSCRSCGGGFGRQSEMAQYLFDGLGLSDKRDYLHR